MSCYYKILLCSLLILASKVVATEQELMLLQDSHIAVMQLQEIVMVMRAIKQEYIKTGLCSIDLINNIQSIKKATQTIGYLCDTLVGDLSIHCCSLEDGHNEASNRAEERVWFDGLFGDEKPQVSESLIVELLSLMNVIICKRLDDVGFELALRALKQKVNAINGFHDQKKDLLKNISTLLNLIREQTLSL